jgi:uncharacterized short protein YbdD (DUF466 family)
MKRGSPALRAIWRGLRTLLGDDAYERYLRHQRERHPEQASLDRQAFYLAEIDRRWTRINRCC